MTAAIAARLAAPARSAACSGASSRRCCAVCRAGFLRSSARGLAAGAPARLDHPGGVAAVLGLALALRLGHTSSLEPTSALRSCGGCAPGCRRGSRRTPPRRQARRARPRATRAWRAIASTTSASGVAPWSSTLQRDLRDAAARRSSQADRAHAGQPLGPALADAARRCPRVGLVAGGCELEVEGDQRRARGDERRAGGRVRRGGPKSGAARRRASGARARRAAAAQLGARAAAGQRAVEEDREPSSSPIRSAATAPRRRPRRARLRVEVDDGRDVERADVRVHAAVAAQVDARRRASRAPASSASASAPGAPASVKTVRLWSGSEWTSSSSAPPAAKASAIARSRRRPAPPRRWGRPGACASEQRSGPASRTLRVRRSSASRRSRRRRGAPAP